MLCSQIRDRADTPEKCLITVSAEDKLMDTLDFGRYVTFTTVSAKPKPAPNAFDMLMNSAQQLRLPPTRRERDNRDRLYNTVITLLKEKKLGWTLGQAETGEKFINMLTAIFWSVSDLTTKVVYSFTC